MVSASSRRRLRNPGPSEPCPSNDENVHSPGPGAIFIWLRSFNEAGSFVTCRRGCLRYTPAMRVLIVGCGYVGLPLGAELVKEGHEVFGARRSASAEAELKSSGIKPLAADI